jgi:hypothetical protein
LSATFADYEIKVFFLKGEVITTSVRRFPAEIQFGVPNDRGNQQSRGRLLRGTSTSFR